MEDTEGSVGGRALLPGKVLDRSMPHLGQQGTALRLGGGSTGTVIVIVVDDMFIPVVIGRLYALSDG